MDDWGWLKPSQGNSKLEHEGLSPIDLSQDKVIFNRSMEDYSPYLIFNSLHFA